MNDIKIVIDPGHGGSDPGAIGNGITEKDLTLKISNYMYDKFRELGIPVKITRSTDETLTPTERVNRVLSAFGNNSDVVVISNHINAGGGDGAEVIYALRNNDTLSNLILNEIGKEGQNIRSAYQRRLPSNQSKDYYFMQRNTGNTETVTVEYGFLDSTKDDVNQLKNNWQEYADAVIRAVLTYKGISTPQQETSYIVQKGDSLWSISKKYGLSVDEIKSANNLNNTMLTIGQILIIPIKQEDSNLYTVKSGDSLYSISNKYGITVNELIKLNNLKSNILSIGQQLIVPTITEKQDDIYMVQSGDTLYKLSQKYNTTVEDLMKLNNLSTNILSIGQILKLPTEESTEIYIVKAGDNLYNIAKKYNTTVDNIKQKNNLTSNIISIGQELII